MIFNFCAHAQVFRAAAEAPGVLQEVPLRLGLQVRVLRDGRAGMIILIVHFETLLKYILFKLQGDHSGRRKPPVDLVPTVLATYGPLL